MASLPVYYALFHRLRRGGAGDRSDIGIAAHTIALALLLHRRGLVPVSGLSWSELAKAGLTAVAAGTLGMRVAALVRVVGSRWADVASLALGTLTWAAARAAGLWILRSELPKDLRRRTAQPAVEAEKQVSDLSAGVEP